MSEEKEALPDSFKKVTASKDITVYGSRIHEVIVTIPKGSIFFLEDYSSFSAYTSQNPHGATGTHKFYEVYFGEFHGYILDDDAKGSITKSS